VVLGSGCPQLSRTALDEIRALHEQGRYEESIEDLRVLMDADPSDPEVNYLFGGALMHSGDISLAIWSLRKAVESQQYAVDAGRMLAQAMLDSRAAESAIDVLDRVLELEPDNLDALALRAHANLETAHYAEALVDVERAVEIDPDHRGILVPRVLTLLEFERVDEAEAVLAAAEYPPEVAGELERDGVLARLCLANAAMTFESGDRESAEVLYRDCLDAYPSQPRVVLQAVDFYSAIGQPDRATELLRRAFEETRAKTFGYALTRRASRSGDGD
jgi:predicted Zn-dependent protease